MSVGAFAPNLCAKGSAGTHGQANHRLFRLGRSSSGWVRSGLSWNSWESAVRRRVSSGAAWFDFASRGLFRFGYVAWASVV